MVHTNKIFESNQALIYALVHIIFS